MRLLVSRGVVLSLLLRRKQMMKKPRIKFKRLELRSALVNRLWLFELFLVAAMCCLKALTATKTIKAAGCL